MSLSPYLLAIGRVLSWTWSNAQSIVAVVGLLFAAWVYFDWRSQELAKRRADYAMEVLRGASVWQDCFDRRREYFYYPLIGLDRQYLQRLTDRLRPTWEKIDTECSAPMAAFGASTLIANEVLSPQVASRMLALSKLYSDVQVSQVLLTEYASEAVGTRPRQIWRWRRAVRRAAREAGAQELTWEKVEPDTFVARYSPDTLRPRAVAARESLVETVKPFIRLQ